MPTTTPEVTGTFVDLPDGRYYRITSVENLPPFFMNIVSPTDLWMFAASNGALTAGREHADRALFPYQTVDRIYDSAGQIGPFTALHIHYGNAPAIHWEPFAPHALRPRNATTITRNLLKSIEGDRIWFEETHHTLGLTFRYGWASAHAHGLVRRCELINHSTTPARIKILDSLRNLLVPGITQQLQNAFSCLADAYKTAEHIPGTHSLAIYSMSSGITDRAVPMESLRATAVWSEGLPPDATLHLSERAIETFLRTGHAPAENTRRGLRTTWAISATIDLPPSTTHSWIVVADTGLTQTDISALATRLRNPTPQTPAILNALHDSTTHLRAIVGAADGLQHTGDEPATAHHFANVLFNIMRGGIFDNGHHIPGPDFHAFVHTRQKPTAQRHSTLLQSLPPTLTLAQLRERLATTTDPNLIRLGLEYLPLTFSRRHGDPSRPWNKFSIRIRDPHTNARLLNYEGNWRDIFQNWEALALSHPEFLENIIAKFLNATTPDGFNPYRITRTGIDWEIPEPDNPWAGIGYWGDHQTIYLSKLLEWSARIHPGRLAAWLRLDLFTHANVPYRITGYDNMRRDPRDTITFDHALHDDIMRRSTDTGTDARLLTTPDGSTLHVNLTEKLLTLILARITHLIPGAGIWMNTQRPEWNDANNALVGYGVSVVTLAYLRRLLAHWQNQILPALGTTGVPISGALATLFDELTAALDTTPSKSKNPIHNPADRRALVDLLATAGTRHREQLYRHGPGPRRALSPAHLAHFTTQALALIDASLRAQHRDDGLYHSYNLLRFTDSPPPPSLEISHLAPMLEGQVAILSSGLLTPTETIALLDALRHSPLYRPDQHSYRLYPDRQLPGFLDRNIIPPEHLANNPLLTHLTQTNDTRLITHSITGETRFNPDLVNHETLDTRLAELARDPTLAPLIATHADTVRHTYEHVFHHRAFTGRSGTMFGYEGLDCIYWHMVSKLLLAVQENFHTAQAANHPAAPTLATAYYDIRSGLSFNKTPATYGAFPTDPYSHTPGHSGAQQPGMTGQVKEEILTRLGELGVNIDNGHITLRPTLLRSNEFLPTPSTFHHTQPDGSPATLDLPAGSLAFTLCGVPIIYQRGTHKTARIHISANGSSRTIDGSTLDHELSQNLLNRTGHITRLTLDLPAHYQPLAN